MLLYCQRKIVLKVLGVTVCSWDISDDGIVIFEGENGCHSMDGCAEHAV